MALSPPSGRDGFRVAIICALSLEAGHVQAVLDRCWEDEGEHYGKAPGDQNAYTTGVIGRHNVVLAYMPGMGNNNAAAVAAGLRSSFLNIQLALVVGICGAVPTCAETKEDVVLGDVIISTAVIQYDFGRQYPSGFRRKRSVEDSLGRANPEIRAMIAKMKTRPNLKKMKDQLKKYLKELQTEVFQAKYPGEALDRLFESTYVHQHRVKEESCHQCGDTVETCSKSCEDLGCERSRSVIRSRSQHSQTSNNDNVVAEHIPSIHFGRFGSGNTVLKSGEERDKLAKLDGFTAFEMEGAGVWEQFPTVVIKGACDYADSHKNQEWQEYAAATAAAGMKAFLKEWVTTDQVLERAKTQTPIVLHFEKNGRFVGRANKLDELRAKTSSHDSCQRVAIYGLGGCGKTALAVQFAYCTRKERPNCAIFWVPALSRESFENAYRDIGKALQIPGIDNKEVDMKELVRRRLNDEKSGEWLMIVDNADDTKVLFDDVKGNMKQKRLIDYLPQSCKGSIVFTTRNEKAATKVANTWISLNELSQSEGLELLKKSLLREEQGRDETSLRELLSLLDNLPLAIVQAAAFINENSIPVKDYIAIFQNKTDERIELLSTEFEDRSRYRATKSPIAITWHISFDQIRNQDLLAAEYLSFMACIVRENIPQSLLPKAQSLLQQKRAIGTLKGYAFITERPGNVFDMHRLVHLATWNWLVKDNRSVSCVQNATRRMSEMIPYGGHEKRSIWAAYLPHAIHISNLIEIPDVKMHIDVLHRIGRCESDLGRYSAAETMHKRELASSQKVLGIEHPDTLTSMSNVAKAIGNQGNYVEAEKAHREVLGLSQKVLGVEHSDTFISMFSVAQAIGNQGNYVEAEKAHREVLGLSQKVLGDEHPDTLTSMSSVAQAIGKQGNYVEAEKAHREVLKRYQKVLGVEHPHTLVSMSEIALAISKQGKCIQAETLYRQALSIRQKVSGEQHPETLTVMENLAWVINDQDRVTESMELMASCLHSSVIKLGYEHPRTKSRRACLLSWQNLYQEAPTRFPPESSVAEVRSTPLPDIERPPTSLGNHDSGSFQLRRTSGAHGRS